jgi:hypothetical protein
MAQQADPPTGYLDIGPLAGEFLLGRLLEAIGACGPESRVTTVITSGSRPLAVLAPPAAGGPWPDRGQELVRGAL